MKFPDFFILESLSTPTLSNPQPQKHEASQKPFSSLSTTPLSLTQQRTRKRRERERDLEREKRHETAERIPSLHSAIHSSVEEKLSTLMAAQAILFSPDFLLSLLHLPHIHHREGH